MTAAMFNKILKSSVAVVSVLCILFATTVYPVFAAEDIPDTLIVNRDGDIIDRISAEDFKIKDYLISYEDYLFYLDNASNFDVSAGSAAILDFSGGLAWSSAFASAGAVCSTPGLFFLGIALACAGGVVYGVEGTVSTLIEEGPTAYYNFVELIHRGLDPDRMNELDAQFFRWISGDSIEISEGLSQDIADIINGMQLSDGHGNVVDTSVSISADYIAGVFEETYPNNTYGTKYETLLSFDKTTDSSPSAFASNGTLCINLERRPGSWSPTDNFAKITNLLTGTSIEFNLASMRFNFSNLVRRISDFYYVHCADGGSFWISYVGESSIWSGAEAIAPNIFSDDYPLIIEDSGTILDDKVITSVVYDVAQGSWVYSGDGFSYPFPLDPIGLLISNTGVLTTGGSASFTATANPGIYNPAIPPTDFIPSSVDKDIGVPLVDTVLSDASLTFSDSLVGTQVANPDLSLENKDSFMTFLNNINSYFAGLFDWLPYEFKVLCDFMIDILKGAIIAMGIVKIVDLVWP